MHSARHVDEGAGRKIAIERMSSGGSFEGHTDVPITAFTVKNELKLHSFQQRTFRRFFWMFYLARNEPVWRYHEGSTWYLVPSGPPGTVLNNLEKDWCGTILVVLIGVYIWCAVVTTRHESDCRLYGKSVHGSCG